MTNKREGRVFQRPGRKGWWIEYYEAGRKVRLKIDGPRAEAERTLRRKTAIKALRRRQRVGAATNRVRLDTLAEEYLAEASLRIRPRTLEEYARALRLILADLNAEYVEDLTPAMMTLYAQERRNKTPERAGQEVSARTIQIQIGTLKQMLNWAERSQAISHNPIKSVRRPRQAEKKYRRALTDGEVDRLLSASPPRYARIWLLFLHTGLRKTELMRLTWEHADLETREIHVPAEIDKGGKDAWLPMTDEVHAALTEECAERGDVKRHDPIFVNLAGRPWRNNLLTRFRACLKLAGIDAEGVDIHALRYTFCTSLLANGVDVSTAQRLTRHADVRILLEIYRHVAPADKRSAIERLSCGRRQNRPQNGARSGGQSGTESQTA